MAALWARPLVHASRWGVGSPSSSIRARGRTSSSAVDLTLTLVNFAACALYLWYAIGAFYGSRGLARAGKAAGLAFIIVLVALACRFAIFLITLWSA